MPASFPGACHGASSPPSAAHLPVLLQAPAATATSAPPLPAAQAPVAVGTAPTTAGMTAVEHIPFHAYEPRTATEVANRSKDTAEDLAEAARSAPS
jgi:hypothetical protein